MGMLRRVAAVGCTLACVAALASMMPSRASAAPSDHELALRWAPIHYQDTDSSNYDADYLSAVDFDGDWDMLNNWEHQDDNPSWLKGAVSYSVVETSTHWFIVYAFFHPRDWTDAPDPFDNLQHENDMEGVLLTVRKDGSTYGTLDAMVTVAHDNFYSYVPAGSAYSSGRESVDGSVRLRTYNAYAHPTTRQEAKGHGAYAWGGGSFPGDDGIIYYPSTGADAPSGGNDRSVSYRLVGVFDAAGMWARRANSITFASFGTFRGNNGEDNAANAPWGWDDHNDGSDLPRGLLATDPAHLVSAYFAGEGTFSRSYTRNSYQ